MKKRQNPKSRLLYRKWIVEYKFDPYNPSRELLTELYEWKIPCSRYVAKEFRGELIARLTGETASYIAFESIMGSPEIRLLAALRYYIYLAGDEEVSKQDMYSEITNLKECGIIAEINAIHLKDKWSVE